MFVISNKIQEEFHNGRNIENNHWNRGFAAWYSNRLISCKENKGRIKGGTKMVQDNNFDKPSMFRYFFDNKK